MVNGEDRAERYITMTRDEFVEALDWAIGATVDPGGYLMAWELKKALDERLNWLEALAPIIEPKAAGAPAGDE